jgi:hypothetical protein
MIAVESAMTVLSYSKRVQAENFVINDFVSYWVEPATDGGLPFMIFDIRTPITEYPDVYERVVYWFKRSAAETGFRAVQKNNFLDQTFSRQTPRGNFVRAIFKKKIKDYQRD